jgi:hypothetical protein
MGNKGNKGKLTFNKLNCGFTCANKGTCDKCMGGIIVN